MADVGAAVDNGAALVKRGRGRPRKVRIPVEAFDDQMFIATMRDADQIEATRSMKQLVAEKVTVGLHPGAFALCRRLVKQGPTEARAFHQALTRYLAAAGLIDQSREGAA
jgi:hypothetical protein